MTTGFDLKFRLTFRKRTPPESDYIDMTAQVVAYWKFDRITYSSLFSYIFLTY